MARVALVEVEQAPLEVKEIYEQKLKGKPGNVHKALANRPDVFKNFLPFYSSVGRALDRKLYEMVYIRVSMINGCRYCLQHHLAACERVGLTAQDWASLKTGNYSGFTEKELEALTYTDKLTRAPSTVDDEDFFRLKKHFADPEIVDLHLLVGVANLTNRFTDPLGLELEMAEEKI